MDFLKTIIFFFAGLSIAYSQTLVLDETFNVPGAGLPANRAVKEVLMQPDGKIIIVGTFPSFNGTTVNKILRLNSDGSLDTDFNTGTGADQFTINAAALDASGNIYVGGDFKIFNGFSRKAIVKLYPDGSLDPSFQVNFVTDQYDYVEVYDIVVDNSGKILIGGDISISVPNAGMTHQLARLNQDDSIDGTFISEFNEVEEVYTIEILPDNKILAGGYFLNDITSSGLARLNTDGSKDLEFLAAYNLYGYVFDIYIQQDNKIVVGGLLLNPSGNNYKILDRINPDGSNDLSFEPFIVSSNNTANNVINEIRPYQGKLLVGGQMSTYNGNPADDLMLMNYDGTRDNSFDIGTGFQSQQISKIEAIAVLPDNSIIVGGQFASFDGSSVYSLAHLTNSSLSSDDFSSHQLFIYNVHGELKFESGSVIDEIAIYDLTGRELFSKTNIASSEYTTEEIISNQILIIHVKQEKDVRVIKVLN